MIYRANHFRIFTFLPFGTTTIYLFIILSINLYRKFAGHNLQKMHTGDYTVAH